MSPFPVNDLHLFRAARLISGEAKTVLFVTSLLRAREIKMATALRRIGWKVILIYMQTTPFTPEHNFDVAIRVQSEEEAHRYARALWPRICHVFSGAVDGLVLRFCRDKPAPVVIDLNDIFCPSLFDYCHERFEPTKECLEKATGLCARDLQTKFAARADGFKLPRYKILFPEYSWKSTDGEDGVAPKGDWDEVRVVSVGTFCLETLGMYDSGYLQLARMLTEQRIHLHIYPHWFYRKSMGSAFNWDLKKDFVDFFRLQEQTGYLHIHESLPLDALARELPKYDFGIVAGGSPALGQTLKLLKPDYMRSCYSGRIADYLDARLPVLINKEVGFNYWLLKRYGLSVDLEGLLHPGFREKLLAIKLDRERAKRVETAAHMLSIDRNVPRLAAFYERIMDDYRRIADLHPNPWWMLVKQIPLVRRPFWKVESTLQTLDQTISRLRDELRERDAERHDLNQVIGRLERELGLRDSALSGLRSTVQEREKTLAKLNDEQKKNDTIVQTHNQAIQQLRDVIREREAEIVALTQGTQRLRDELRERDAGLQGLNQTTQQLRDELRDIDSGLQGPNQTTQQLRDALRERDANISELNQITQQLRDALRERDAIGQNASLVVIEAHAELEKEKGKTAAQEQTIKALQQRLSQMKVGFRIENSKQRLELELGSRWADEVSGLLNWPAIKDKTEQTNGMQELLEMIQLFASGSGSLGHISSCWDVLNFKNLNQLLRDGYRNFKRTIGFNYFNFLIQKGDPQIEFLEAKLDHAECELCRKAAASLPDDPNFDWRDQASYRYFVLLLWTYVRKMDTMRYLDQLEEPREGNPIVVPLGNQRASQDLANSLIEYYSMREVIEFEKCKRVLEIGGGYGRDAYVVMKANPHIQYTLVDIPPALFIAQRYLSSVFNGRKIFQVQDFTSFNDVQQDMEQASIVCLLPHQLELLPNNYFDVSINISSFGEMQPAQIKTYMQLLEHLTLRYFYMKQWKVSKNAFDHLSLSEEDYPVSRKWSKVYSRTCRVQTDFFEALYRVPSNKS